MKFFGEGHEKRKKDENLKCIVGGLVKSWMEQIIIKHFSRTRANPRRKEEQSNREGEGSRLEPFSRSILGEIGDC